MEALSMGIDPPPPFGFEALLPHIIINRRLQDLAQAPLDTSVGLSTT